MKGDRTLNPLINQEDIKPQKQYKYTDWQIYKNLLVETKPVVYFFIITIIGFTVYGAANSYYVRILQQIVDYIDKTTNIIVPSILSGYMSFPLFLVFSIITSSFISGIGTFLGQYSINLIAAHVEKSMRIKLYNHYLKMTSQEYDKANFGDLLSSLTFNVEQLTASISNGLVILIRESLMILFLFGFMLFYSWRLTLIFFLVAPCAGFIINFSGKKFRYYSKKIQDQMGEINQLASELIRGNEVVKIYGSADYEIRRFNQVVKKFYIQKMKNTIVFGISNPLIQLILASIMGIVTFIALQDDFFENFTAGNFISFFMAAGLLARPIKRLSEVNRTMQKGLAAGHAIYEKLDLPIEKDSGNLCLFDLKGNISVKNLSFKYEKTDLILNDVSFNLKEGETIAIVGKSGSGKTTLVNLLMKFYEVNNNLIKIDGFDINKINTKYLRKNISLVSQKNLLFNTSIVDNITYGFEGEVDETRLHKAIMQSYCDDFVYDLPNGINTIVGENGVLLSGGQCQRIAIARAFYKQAKILILDEATSALDSESESKIQKALEILTFKTTTIIIAHRLSTVQKADNIIVLQKGKLVEQGIHFDLINNNGAYAKLYKTQILNTVNSLSASRKKNLDNEMYLLEYQQKNKKGKSIFKKIKNFIFYKK